MLFTDMLASQSQNRAFIQMEGEMQGLQARVLGADQAPAVQLGGLGVRFLIDGARSGAGFALVEHPLQPRALGSPLHRHSHEDEYSYVLRGRVGAKLGDDVVFGGPGDLIFKPRGQWHAFWNAGDDQASLVEIIAPAGFEDYFRELGELFAGERPPLERVPEVAARYGLEIDPSTIPALCAEFGLRFG
jgi:quercetin dioxygenase-like cupin family protein